MIYKTPVQKMQIKQQNNIYIKREDLIPFCFGGNKARIALNFIEDMKKKNCDCILAYGSASSNMCRVLSNMCKAKSIDCYILSSADENGKYEETTFNSIMARSCRYPIEICKKDEVSQKLEKILNTLRLHGHKPYYIYDRTSLPAALQAYAEVYTQICSGDLKFDYIFLASGTGLTQAGLICGKISSQPYASDKIVGISVSRAAEKETEIIYSEIKDFFGDGAHIPPKEEIVHFTDKYMCGGYGKRDKSILRTILDIYHSNGIALDPIYTGKAFHGMLRYLDDNEISGKNILFIHTGGTPIFYDNLKEITEA